MQLASQQNLSQLIAQLKSDFETQINRAKKHKNYDQTTNDIEDLELLLRERLEVIEKQVLNIQHTVSSTIEPDEQIKLNIGGQIFPVLKSTLLKHDKNSMFNSMFSGRYPLKKADDGSIFIDRDPTHFSYILNYLRDGTEVVLPDSFQVKEEIFREADFYNLEGLIWILQGKILRVKELGPVNIAMKADEDKIRRLFLDHPKHELLNNPYVHLLEVFDEKIQPSFAFPPPSETDATLPLLFSKKRWLGFRSSIVQNYGIYEAKWRRLCPLLSGLNWNNVVAAGGSVLACLAKYPAQTEGGKPPSPEIQGGDVDLFLWGLDENQAREKINEIYDCVRKNKKQPVVVVRTSRTITFVCGYPQRHIQIILRLYRSPAEVILGFDLDCCCVLYDGKKVWALPRARRALNYRYNIADPTRQTFRTTSYEYRLWKYSKRWFAVAVPGFRRSQVDKDIFKKEFEDLKGFAKLLFLEEKDWITIKSVYNRQQTWFELNDQLNYDKSVPTGIYRWEESKYKESNERFLQTLNAPQQNGNETMTNLTDMDVVGSLIDYNNGVLLPFSEITTTHGIFNRLSTKTNYIIKNTPEGQTINLYYTFGWDLEQALEASKFHILQEVKRDFNLHVPKNIEFIGSLAQYIQSLPEVEEDWFAEGLVDYQSLDLDVDV